MKKLLLVLFLISPMALSYAGNVNAEKNSAPVEVTKHSSFIKPDANKRLVLKTQAVSELEAIRKRMSAPIGSSFETDSREMEIKSLIEANEARIRIESEKIQNRLELNRIIQKNNESRNNTGFLEEMEDAPRMAPHHERPYQWDQPYQAFGDNLKLSRLDFYGKTNTASARKFGETVYLYDSEGNPIGEETTMSNKDKVAQNFYGWAFPIPENAMIKIISSNSDDLRMEHAYYIDPATGAQVDIELYRARYYNGNLVELINQSLDRNGKMTVYSKIESEFDAQDRPLVTTNYHQVFDSLTQSPVLEPYRKVEYQYPSNGFITTMDSYSTVQNGAIVWVPNSRVTSGTTSDGEYSYERYYYDSENNYWYGSSKYIRLESDDDSEYRYTSWSWNYDEKKWVGSYKRYYKYNSKGNTTYSEYYRYSEDLQDFYLNYKRGYDFQGDTLQIGEWSIYYNTPATQAQLLQPDSLIYSGSKSEYKSYTKEELGWDFDANPRLSTPQKSVISYTLDMTDLSDLKWIPTSKREYEYVLAKPYYEDYAGIYTSCEKTYSWIDTLSVWSVPSEIRQAYDQYANRVRYERYIDGQLFEKNISEFEYTLPDQDHEFSYRTKLYESWYMSAGELVCRYRDEYKYDSNGLEIEQISYNYLDNATQLWRYGNKYEYAYDSEGRRTSYSSYDLDVATNTWIGNYKEIVKYDRFDEVCQRESFYGLTDTLGNFVWLGRSYEETRKDDQGNEIYYLYYSSWNERNDDWSYGNKQEYTYSPSGFLTEYVSYYYSEGTWRGSDRYAYVFDDEGRVLSNTEYQYDSWDKQDWYINRKSEYTYTESGELKDTYIYNGSYDSELKLSEKEIAQISDGKIVGYNDSVLYDDTWHPSSKVEYLFDDATDQMTSLQSSWSSWSESWTYTSKSVEQLDTMGNVLLSEEYSWDSYSEAWIGHNKVEHAYNAAGSSIMTANYYWKSSDSIWVGNNKYEEEADAAGNRILYAYYYWDSNLNEWYGSYKNQYAYDENGNQTLSAYYNWDTDKRDWRGNGKSEYAYDANGYNTLRSYYEWDDESWNWTGEYKYEYQYDSDGNTIMNAYYYGTDTLGNWIGDRKGYYFYDEDSVYHYKYYGWDDEKGDWIGENKYDTYYTDNKNVRANYEWDYEAWCWVGTYRTEYEYTDEGDITTEYKWDAEKNEWTGSSKKIYKFVSSDLSDTSIYTLYNWVDENKSWVLSTRETDEQVYRSDYNLDYASFTTEAYDVSTGSWTVTRMEKEQYIYSSLTGVDAVAIETSVRVQDGQIIVSAQDNARIDVVSASGAQVATGQGEIAVQVVPGTYLVVVGNKTVKVLVR